MPKDRYNVIVSGIDAYYAAVSFLALGDVNDEESKQNDMDENLDFEAIYNAIKNNWFNHRMIFLSIRVKGS